MNYKKVRFLDIFYEMSYATVTVIYRWRDGRNHLIFSMMSGIAPDYNTTLDISRGKSMLAGGGFNLLTYRVGFDVSIPVFNSLLKNLQISPKSHL